MNYGRINNLLLTGAILDIQELFLPGGMYFADELFAEHAPGAYFSYTNCTWGSVAAIVERVSGERFDNYGRGHILQPLGMQDDFNVAEMEALDDIYADERRNLEWAACILTRNPNRVLFFSLTGVSK